jgi:hypothetical protein
LRGILFILQAQNLLSKKYQTPLIRDSTMALVIAAANSTPLNKHDTGGSNNKATCRINNRP